MQKYPRWTLVLLSMSCLILDVDQANHIAIKCTLLFRLYLISLYYIQPLLLRPHHRLRYSHNFVKFCNFVKSV